MSSLGLNDVFIVSNNENRSVKMGSYSIIVADLEGEIYGIPFHTISALAESPNGSVIIKGEEFLNDYNDFVEAMKKIREAIKKNPPPKPKRYLQIVQMPGKDGVRFVAMELESCALCNEEAVSFREEGGDISHLRCENHPFKEAKNIEN